MTNNETSHNPHEREGALTRDDIIRMAREAGIPTSEVVIKGNGTHLRSVDIERFAALIAAAEREACAKVCCQACAAAIRAREEAEKERNG